MRTFYKNYVHAIAVPQANAATLQIDEAYAVVAAVTATGSLTLPLGGSTPQIIAGGMDGLPYAPALVQPSGPVDFLFGEPIVAVVITTYSNGSPSATPLA